MPDSGAADEAGQERRHRVVVEGARLPSRRSHPDQIANDVQEAMASSASQVWTGTRDPDRRRRRESRRDEGAGHAEQERERVERLSDGRLIRNPMEVRMYANMDRPLTRDS